MALHIKTARKLLIQKLDPEVKALIWEYLPLFKLTGPEAIALLQVSQRGSNADWFLCLATAEVLTPKQHKKFTSKIKIAFGSKCHLSLFGYLYRVANFPNPYRLIAIDRELRLVWIAKLLQHTYGEV